MNGIHDLGGMDGFGSVEVEKDEPVFHSPWEARVFGCVAALAGQLGNVHRFRHAIERMDPAHYLSSSYYEHWLTAAATLAVETGLVSPQELEARAGGTVPLSGAVRDRPGPDGVESGEQPRFAVGSAVVVRNLNPWGHTRCPRYVRGKRGVVVRVDRRHAFPDVAAHADHACRQFQYCVRFSAAELWGAEAEAGEAMHVDLSEGYLEKA